jgi:ABC-type nitrate/sulfonate/bicarbonate transport system ATPase subunit
MIQNNQALSFLGTKSFSKKGFKETVFQNLNLSFERGVSFLMGPNGCGKSTFLRSLLDLEKLDNSIISYSLSEEDKKASVLQNYKSQLLPFCSVKRNIEIVLNGTFYDKDLIFSQIKDRLASWDYKINFNANAGNLSGGQQQAVVLARSMVFKPSLWLLDEPVSAIDYKRRLAILEDIQQFSKNIFTIICTHDFNDAILIGNRLIVFNNSMQITLDKIIPPEVNFGTERKVASESGNKLRDEILKNIYSKY